MGHGKWDYGKSTTRSLIVALSRVEEGDRVILLARGSCCFAVHFITLGITLGWCWKAGFFLQSGDIRVCIAWDGMLNGLGGGVGRHCKFMNCFSTRWVCLFTSRLLFHESL